jgi:hypothetical protein
MATMRTGNGMGNLHKTRCPFYRGLSAWQLSWDVPGYAGLLSNTAIVTGDTIKGTHHALNVRDVGVKKL